MNTLAQAALAYHAAKTALDASCDSEDYWTASAYLALGSAVNALRTTGNLALVDAANQVNDLAHALAPAYERNRRTRELAGEAERTTRNALGYSRSLARTLNQLADDTGDSTPAIEAMQSKILQVAEWVDAEVMYDEQKDFT